MDNEAAAAADDAVASEAPVAAAAVAGPLEDVRLGLGPDSVRAGGAPLLRRCAAADGASTELPTLMMSALLVRKRGGQEAETRSS